MATASPVQNASPRHRCEVCGKEFDTGDLMPLAAVREPIRDLILRKHPQVSLQGYICFDDLNFFRGEYIEDVLEDERGQLTQLEDEVVRSFREHELVAANINAEFDRQLTVGERIADAVAEFGGSWTFILTFAAVLLAWIVLNSYAVLAHPFDPYPYILLNLVLSCLAAVQAPIIMMSQNRQEDRDRLRAEHDYRVNLKAELEIQHINAKLDLLLTKQWQQLLVIQEVQTDLMRDVARKSKNPGR